ncbi:MAG: hypothetical protein KDA44_16140 [Planctomycetales bacterium]|nr:hypothetical protein [Planctomycetales bacterium]
MRLTLRTLLAYMDDILDPADHEELGRKIEASDFAAELIHRSRDASRRLRLGAPDPAAGDGGDLHGGSDELDANTMAEYLDNTLSPEAVAEFERACLAPGDQGDMLLAEAVSCHHILTMVLGEPAEVDPDLRRRMYQLGKTVAQPGQSLRIEPAHTPSAGAAASVPPAPQSAPRVEAAQLSPAATPAEQTQSVPEYLRVASEVKRRKRRMMFAVVAAMAGGAGAFWLFSSGQQELPDEVAQLDESLAEGVEIGPTAPVGEDDAALQPGGGEAPAFTPPVIASTDGAEEEPSAAMADDATESPVDDSDDASTASPAAPLLDDPSAAPEMTFEGEEVVDDVEVEMTADDVGEMTTDEGDVPPVPRIGPLAGDDAASPALDSADLPEMPADDSVAMAASGSPAPRLGSEPLGPPIGADGMAVAAPPAGLDATDEPTADGTEPADDAGPRPLGAYLGMMGAYDMLLGYDGDSGQWRRLPPRTTLADEVQLLTLPTFRTMVNLRDANIYMAGGSQMTVAPAANLPGDPAADFALVVPRGRLIINAGLNGNRVELVVDDRSHVVELQPSSTLAVEVSGRFVPGSDPTAGTAPRTITWYLTTGSGRLIDAAGDRPLTAPMQWKTSADNDATGRPIEELPTWIDHEVVTDIQRRAQKELAPALQPGAPVNIALLELNDPEGAGRLREIRTLASECAAYVDLFEPLVKALGDAEQRAYWKRLIATLRQSLAEDPQAAAALQDALVALRGERDAAALMELVVGYSPEDLGDSREAIQAGPMAGVLRSLASEDLDFRVLAFQNLCDLTGTTGFGYRPEQTAEQRDRKLRVIWNRFQQNDLLPQQAEP